MSKQPRKLWLGEWQPSDDTFLIVPDDEADSPAVAERRDVRRHLLPVAVTVLAFGLGFALSSVNDDKPFASLESRIPPLPAQAPQAQLPQIPQGAPPQGFGGADLTGPEAEKAARAALQRYPGGIERVTRGAGGAGYIVHVVQCNGYEVHVTVDGQFDVQGADGPSAPAGCDSQIPQ